MSKTEMGILGALAQIPAVIILFGADFVASVASSVGLTAVSVIDFLSFTSTGRLAWHKVRYSSDAVVKKDDENEMDVQATLAKSTYPIAPEKLILLAKEITRTEFGCDSPSLLAEDFQFVAPIVGPLPKQEFVKAFANFKVKDAFPDQKANFYNFHVDPQEPNRVWFFSRAQSTHTGNLNFNGKIIKPTGVRVVHPPQALSLLFDDSGKAYTLTVGYVMDRRIGNTGGMGGLFGPLYAVGHPLPIAEGKPWTPSLRLQALERVQKAAAAFGFAV